MGADVLVGDFLVVLVFGAVVGDGDTQRFCVGVDVEPVPVPGEARVDCLEGGLVVGEHERLVDGGALGGAESHGVAVVELRESVEAAVVAPVPDVVGREVDLVALVGGCLDCVVFAAVGVGARLDAVDRDEVAIVEVELAHVGANDEALTWGDQQGLGLGMAACRPRGCDVNGDFLGALFVGKGELAEHGGEGAELVMCARDDERGFVGSFSFVALPVLDQAAERVVEMLAEVEPSAVVVCGNGFVGLTVAQRFGGVDLPGVDLGRVVHFAESSYDFVALVARGGGQILPCFVGRHAVELHEDVLRVCALPADCDDLERCRSRRGGAATRDRRRSAVAGWCRRPR